MDQINQTRDRVPTRGHAAKIEAALTALRADGRMPDWLRPMEVYDRLDAWLKAQGCGAHERPSRSSYQRYFAREKR
jgi:hypothetical protein